MDSVPYIFDVYIYLLDYKTITLNQNKMRTKLVKHPSNYFGFRKDKMYHNGSLKTTWAIAFCRFRFLIY